jgi:hypothetical protein
VEGAIVGDLDFCKFEVFCNSLLAAVIEAQNTAASKASKPFSSMRAADSAAPASGAKHSKLTQNACSFASDRTVSFARATS